MPANGVSTEYLKLNKLGKVPTFEGADGFVLTETIAIAVYRMSPFFFITTQRMRHIIIQLSLSEHIC